MQQVMETRRGQGVCAKGREEEEVLLRVAGSRIAQRSPLTALETLSAKYLQWLRRTSVWRDSRSGSIKMSEERTRCCCC